MKAVTKKAAAWLMVVCMVLGFAPVFGSAIAAEEEPIQVLVWTRTKKDLLAGTVYMFDELFSYSVMYASDYAEMADLQNAIAARGLDATNMQKLLASALASVGKEFSSLTPGDILNLPADVMDDLVVYIFAGLKALGVKVDPLYEKLSANKVVQWFVYTYLGIGSAGADLSALAGKIAAKGLDAADMRKLLESALESVGLDPSTTTLEDIRNLPAKVMDDVVTYIFAGLKALGVDVDELYEKLSSRTIIQWFIQTYITITAETAALTALAEKIAAKGLTAADMRNLLRSALESVGLDPSTITVEEILNLPAEVLDEVVTYIFAGLKALGVDVDELYEKLSSSKILSWFIRTYVSYNMPVMLTCDVPDAVVIDNLLQTVTVNAVPAETPVTFTLSVTDPDSTCVPISFTAVIRNSPKKIADWIRELWQALRSFKLKEVVSILKDFFYSVILGK